MSDGLHQMHLHVGPVRFRIGSAWPQIISELRQLYAAYPLDEQQWADFSVRLEPTRPWRRWFRPSVAVNGDYWLPDAAPLPLSQGLLAAEMAMNLQVALGWRRHLLLHASSVERDGQALVMTGLSGSGKSTLAALLGERGWRFMGDEFAFLDLHSGAIVPFPRLVSLKNAAIDVMQRELGSARFGPLLRGTPKGDIRHLIPPQDAITAMDRTAMPRLLLFPRFGYDAALREIGRDEIFVRLTQASTNYVALGESGFQALTRFVDRVPARAMDFSKAEEAVAMIEQLWTEHA